MILTVSWIEILVVVSVTAQTTTTPPPPPGTTAAPPPPGTTAAPSGGGPGRWTKWVEDMYLNEVKNKMNPLVRPAESFDDWLRVNLTIRMMNFAGLDEQGGSMSTTLSVTHEWYNVRLDIDKIDAKDYGIKRMLQVFPASSAWLPTFTTNDVTSVTRKDFRDNFPIFVYPSGNIFWKAIGSFRTSCSMSFEQWPNDFQVCGIVFTYPYNPEVVEIFAANRSFCFEESFTPDAVWEMSGYAMDTWMPDGAYQQISVAVKMTRKSGFYITTLVAPSIILVFGGTVMFLLPPDSGEKMGVAFAVVLSFFVLYFTVTDTLPPVTDGMPLIYNFYIAAFAVGILASSLAAVVLRLNEQGKTLMERDRNGAADEESPSGGKSNKIMPVCSSGSSDPYIPSSASHVKEKDLVMYDGRRSRNGADGNGKYCGLTGDQLHQLSYKINDIGLVIYMVISIILTVYVSVVITKKSDTSGFEWQPIDYCEVGQFFPSHGETMTRTFSPAESGAPPMVGKPKAPPPAY